MISVCIITKNECEHLNICLERLSHYPMEIIVIDTGSTDNTKGIAAKYTDKIHDFNWCNDFSAARNFAISKASHEYILMIDTDEFVDEIKYDKLLDLILHNPNSLGRIHIKNLYQNHGEEMVSNEYICRLFSKNQYHYTGSVHEQLKPLKESSTDNHIFDAPITLTHVGYNGGKALRQQKATRNLQLLLSELKVSPNDPYLLYQIGKSYFFAQDYSNAIPYFEKAMEQSLDTRLTYVRGMITSFGYCLIYTKQYENALMLEGVYDDFCQDADYLFVLGLIYMHNARFQDAINSFLLATSIPRCDVVGVNSYLAFYNIGVILECLGEKTYAQSYYVKCNNYPPAKEGIQRCIN